MYTSFYTAARGAMEQQKKLDVIGNNLANVNNYGFKPKKATFQDLMYYNLNNYRGEETAMKAGTGIVVETTNTNFDPVGIVTTNGDFDYSIVEKGFFMLRNPSTGAITYTRNGHFSLSLRGNTFYLVNDNGNLVLDENRNAIVYANRTLSSTPAAYSFDILDGMENIGNNEFRAVAKQGNPNYVPGADIRDHTLEMSGVDTADEFTRMIETQRAYSYVLKMVTTSDEVVNTINTLRQ